MQRKLMLAAWALMGLSVAAQIPNIYVLGYQCKRVGETIESTYRLNTAATEGVTFELVAADGTVAATFTDAPAAMGENSYTLDIPAELSGMYTVRLTARAASTAEQIAPWASPTTVSERFTAAQSDDLFSWTRARGIAVDNNPESPFYGNLYIVGTTQNRTAATYKNIFIYNYLMEKQNSDNIGYDGDMGYSGNSSALRATVDDDHNVVICDWNSAARAVAVMNPAEPTAPFTKLLVGSVDGVTTNSTVACASIAGKGENQVLWTVNETAAGGMGILGYAVGESTSPWASAPTYNYGMLGGELKDINGCVIPDTKGGLWVSQTTRPYLIHLNAEGAVDYTSPADLIASSPKGAIAISHDGTRLVYGTTGGMSVYDVTLGETPLVTNIADLKVNVNSNIWQVAIDGGDNVYAIGQSGTSGNNDSNGGICAMALPKEDNSFVATNMIWTGSQTGIDAAEADAALDYADGIITSGVTAEVYTPAGVKVAEGRSVDTRSLAPGVYIVRAGAAVMKISTNPK